MDFGYDQQFFEQPEENEFYEEDEGAFFEEFPVVEPKKNIEKESKLVLAPPKRKRPNLNLAPPRKS